jgi:hypothetical protein
VDGGDELVTPLNVLIGGQASPLDGQTEGRGGGKLPDTTDTPTAEPPGKALPAGVWSTEPTTEQALAVADFTAALGHFWSEWHKNLADEQARIETLAQAKATAQTDPLLALVSDLADPVKLRGLVAQAGRALAKGGAQEILVAWNPLSEGFTPAQMAAWIAKTATNDTTYLLTAITDRLRQIVGTDQFAAFMAHPDAAAYIIERVRDAWIHEFINFGRHDAARASGLTSKTWHTTSTDPRPSHQALNGSIEALDNLFATGQMYPGDWAGGPEEVAGCRCMVTYTR